MNINQDKVTLFAENQLVIETSDKLSRIVSGQLSLLRGNALVALKFIYPLCINFATLSFYLLSESVCFLLL